MATLLRLSSKDGDLHPSTSASPNPEGVEGGEECLESVGRWVRPRMCQICGRIGCCDSWPNRHATRCAPARVPRSFGRSKPGEDWSWCVIDEIAFVLDGGNDGGPH